MKNKEYWINWAKAAGIRASIHTTPLASQENRGKTLLGQ